MKRLFSIILLFVLMVVVSLVLKNRVLANQPDLEEKYQYIGKIDQYRVYKNTEYDYFAQGLDVIYEGECICFFNEMKSHIFIISDGDETLGIKEALVKNRVTIVSLKRVIPDIHCEKN